ncbi:mechanosensitive ion channel protein MscS [Paraoerskovia sediminicola]|uniref:Mechanosensitive ion channel protein MscS n=1 Tax=Paraoerskovia sediminicola TaxID=1138587 RepID=A0ABN6XBK1_9CELL|nr:mechanosensitive ion channel domain-containing protein [Paraoerskovia sediminicola]BDZ41538.1 mechanosensitive ion channel protein MscS [Paraoerskovia sediminicola]
MDDPNISEAAQEAYNVVVTLVIAAIGLAAALVISIILGVVMRRIGRRAPLARRVSERMRRPMQGVLATIALIVAVQVSVPREEVVWRAPVNHVLVIVLIGFGAWLLGALALVLEDHMLDRFTVTPEGASADDRHSRRARTQIQVIRRLTVAAVVIIGIGGALLTFPGARAAGASLFASAGLVSVIAGLAAQTTLSNVFAGMQIAFTDGIRVDDVVVLEGEWGRIEEITLTYVVVHLWDDRRLILPSTFFTTTPFENWTRRQSALLGTVELELDWEVPLDAMRSVLKGLLVESRLWDERVGVIQVTDATGGRVTVRATVSAADAGTLWDLRCFVREGLVSWLHQWAPQALPRTRLGDSVTRDEAPRSPHRRATSRRSPPGWTA